VVEVGEFFIENATRPLGPTTLSTVHEIFTKIKQQYYTLHLRKKEFEEDLQKIPTKE